MARSRTANPNKLGEGGNALIQQFARHGLSSSGFPALTVSPESSRGDTPVLLFLHGMREAGSSASELPKVCIHQSPPWRAMMGRLPDALVIAPQAPSVPRLPAVRSNLVPLKNPSGNKGWTNAYDPRDVVSLYPLNKMHFGVTPAITNHGKINNWTDNRHGIIGYLDDKLVAKTIHSCLTS